MTTAQLEGLIRAIMAIGAGYALKYGIDTTSWVAITGGVVAIATAISSWYSNTLKKQIGNVSKSEEVKAVVVSDQKLADSIPSEKVVSANDTIASIGSSK